MVMIVIEEEKKKGEGPGPAEEMQKEKDAKAVEGRTKKRKEKRSQKERPRSKKKHTKVPVWKLYTLKDNALERKNQNCPRCGPGTFLAAYQNRKYCGKCGWAMMQQSKKVDGQTREI